MAKKRFTDTELWEKGWFMELPPITKLLVKFIRERADHAGVWDCNWSLASVYLGEPVSWQNIAHLKDQFLQMDNGKVVCLGFIEFHYGTLSESSPAHKPVFTCLKKHANDSVFVRVYDSLLNRLQYTTTTNSNSNKKENKGVQGENNTPVVSLSSNPDFSRGTPDPVAESDKHLQIGLRLNLQKPLDEIKATLIEKEDFIRPLIQQGIGKPGWSLEMHLQHIGLWMDAFNRFLKLMGHETQNEKEYRIGFIGWLKKRDLTSNPNDYKPDNIKNHDTGNSKHRPAYKTPAGAVSGQGGY